MQYRYKTRQDSTTTLASYYILMNEKTLLKSTNLRPHWFIYPSTVWLKSWRNMTWLYAAVLTSSEG